MQSQSEHIVSYKPGLTLGLEDETLKESDRRIIISLELAQHIDQNASVKHGLAVGGCDEVRYLLEGEASEFLHDLGCPLHLLSFKREKRLFRIVKLLEVASGSYVVKNVVVLLNKSLANLLILWVQIRHF